jgi:hypothetical protein
MVTPKSTIVDGRQCQICPLCRKEVGGILGKIISRLNINASNRVVFIVIADIIGTIIIGIVVLLVLKKH